MLDELADRVADARSAALRLFERLSVTIYWLARKIVEFCVLTQKGQPRDAGRAIALLANADLGNAFVRTVRVIDFIAVDKENHIGVLLDGAGFAQIGHHRTFIGALFEAAIQLRKRNHRHIQLFCQTLQRARNLGNFSRAVFTGRCRRHQLQIIDNDQTQLPALTRQAPRARSSSGLRAACSSTKICASLILRTACVSFRQSSSLSLPVLKRCASSRPTEPSMRNASCVPGISIENTAIGNPYSIATYSPIFIASEVLPIDGRPATIINSPPCRPDVIRSRSIKPVGVPVTSVGFS